MTNAVKIASVDSERRRVVDAWGSLTWFASAELTQSAVTVGRMRIRPGQSGAGHRHDNADEVIYVISGAVHVRVDGRIERLEAGDALTIRLGTVHAIDNPGTSEAELVLSYSSGAREYAPATIGGD